MCNVYVSFGFCFGFSFPFDFSLLQNEFFTHLRLDEFFIHFRRLKMKYLMRVNHDFRIINSICIRILWWFLFHNADSYKKHAAFVFLRWHSVFCFANHFSFYSITIPSSSTNLMSFPLHLWLFSLILEINYIIIVGKVTIFVGPKAESFDWMKLYLNII